MSDDTPSTLKRSSTERRSIMQRYRKLMKRESRDFANNTDENGENFLEHLVIKVMYETPSIRKRVDPG